jgi:hypothetical protein
LPQLLLLLFFFVGQAFSFLLAPQFVDAVDFNFIH